MTYNTLFKPAGRKNTLDVIDQARADVIGLQEIGKSKLRYLARQLRYYYYQFPNTGSNMNGFDTGILSKYPITGTFQNGVLVQLSDHQSVAVFNVHLSPYPYQPYKLRDGNLATVEEVLASAKDSRVDQIEPVLQEMQQLLQRDIPVFLTGDFNEPSHLDWTEQAARTGKNFHLAIPFPVSSLLAAHGFTDAYRHLFCDELLYPGETWTTRQGEDEVHDRIDFVYFKNPAQQEFALTNVQLIGETSSKAEIVIPDYPSDHRAVVATFEVQQDARY